MLNEGESSLKNIVKEKMLKGEKTLGTFHEIGSASALECIGYAGLDYAIIDTEHGPFSVETTQSLIRAAKVSNVTPFVRVKDGERNSILKTLDVGAMGIIIPNVHTVEEVREIVKYGKFYPIGERGIAPTSGSSFWYADYAKQGLEHYFQVSNNEALIIPQCETVGCLENIEEIVRTEGVDGIFIGPYDLSAALGKPGQLEDEEVKAVIQKVVDACKLANKFSFIYAGSEEAVKKYYAMGIDSVTYKMDIILLTEAYQKLLANIK